MCKAIISQIEKRLSSLEAKSGGTPAPMPAKAPRDGSTNDELQCIKLAYLLYRIELLDGVPPATAWTNYCTNFDGCYPE